MKENIEKNFSGKTMEFENVKVKIIIAFALKWLESIKISSFILSQGFEINLRR